ncbi:MAG: S8 family serine peptidase, partial [Limisphaerales bacterium]
MAVCALALLGASVFWRLGERRARTAVPPATAPQPAAAAPAPGLSPAAGAAAGAPAPLTLTGSGLLGRPDTNAAEPAKPAEAFGRKAGERELTRLRNTDRDLDLLARDDRAILLRNALLDTRQPLPAVPEHLRAATEPGAWIVQSHGPVDQSLREYVALTGAEIVSYLPNNAYLVKSSTAQAGQLRRSPRVAAVLPYEPWYKLEDSLLRLARDRQPLVQGTELNVVLLPGTEATAEAAFAGLGAEVLTRSRTPFGPQWALRTPADSLAPLARLAELQTIEPRRGRALLNDLTRTILGVSTTATNEPLQGTNFLGLTGSNVWININDTGIDATHPDLAGRVEGNDPSVLADFNGHGTHVAGTVAGTGSQSATITNLPGSVVPGADLRGKAPAAQLFAQPIDLQTGPLISDAYLQENAATNYYVVKGRRGVPISNNSWGYVGAYEYDVAAAGYDAAVRDALDQVTGEQPILFVFAAGNDGFGSEDGQDGEPGSISSPATAKNVITVGATELFRNITNHTVLTNDITGEVTTNFWFLGDTDSNDQVVSFSSRGNVGLGVEGRFGRFKPDVVGPGSFIASTRSKDWIDPERFYDSIVQLYRDQRVNPAAFNNYLLFAPDDAESFSIRLLPTTRSPVPFPGIPLYLAYDRLPDPVGDLIGTGNLASVPPDRPFRPGYWYFSVSNPFEDPLFYNVLSVITLSSANIPYFEELKKLNDGLAPSYRYESGTSMAAPAVTGFLGLMQEWFQRENRRVSPALLKALLINGSRSLGPLYSFETRPNINYQGWGRPNLTNT